MTICTGGAVSQQKAGTSRYIYMGGAALGALLNNIPTAWAVPFAALLAAATYDMQTICNADPPGYPTFTSTDLLTLTSPTLAQFHPESQQKFSDLITTALWYLFCECSSGTQPTPPAGPAAPADVPSITPGISMTGPILPCNTRQGTGKHIQTGVGKNYEPWGDERFSANRIKVPSGATQYQVKATSIVGGTHHSSIQVYANECSNPSDTIGSEILLGTIASGASATYTRTIPAGIVEIGAMGYDSPYNGAVEDDSLFYELDIFCGAVPGTTTSPCCPADQYTQGVLQQLLMQMQLLQRYLLPFGTIASTAHTGLTNQGTITVEGLAGVKVAVTTMPGSLGQEISEPTYFFDVGFLSVENTDGLIQQTRITSANQVWTPRLMGTASKIGYSLHPGVVVTLTELKPEP